jgi:hypothetical protein
MTVVRRGTKLRDWLKDRIGDSTVLGYPTNHHCAGVYARAAMGRASGYYSANDIARAVIKAGKRRRGKAPIGAARLWIDSSFGHIAAVYDSADTKVICNDYRNGGRIAVVARSAYDNLYDAGWCYPEDIPGWAPVAPGANATPSVSRPLVHVSHVQPGDTGSEVLIMQKALNSEPKISLDYSSGPGIMGPRTTAAYREWELLLKRPANGAPDLTSLTALGNRHGFRVSP